jgi:hypothetical protein
MLSIMKYHFLKNSVLLTAMLVLSAAAFGQRAGGYIEIPNSDKGAKAAALFAVKAESDKTGKTQTLRSIAHAERQIVAGTNYRLCLRVISAGEEDEAEIIHFVKTVVYMDLKGVYKLTSWEDSDCGEDEDG